MSEFLLLNDIKQIVENLSDVSNQFSGKTVLLTGGRGFLGRYFMEIFNFLNERVLKDKAKVIVLDNLITAGKEGAEIPIYKNVEFINHNVIQKFTLDEPVHYIIHAAGIASPYYYRAYPLETLEVAIKGTQNMLEIAELNSAKLTFFHLQRFMETLIQKIFLRKKVTEVMYLVVVQEHVTTRVKESAKPYAIFITTLKE